MDSVALGASSLSFPEVSGGQILLMNTPLRMSPGGSRVTTSAVKCVSSGFNPRARRAFFDNLHANVKNIYYAEGAPA